MNDPTDVAILHDASPELRAIVAVDCMRRADRIQAEESQVGWNGVPRSRAEAMDAALREFVDDYALFGAALSVSGSPVASAG